MTQADQLLGEVDEAVSSTVPPSDRRVITQAYDLSVNTLMEQWDDHTLTVPSLQRGYVWPNGKASRLIESLLLNIPIPVLYFAETEDARYEVIDGHQRIRSIVRFIQNEFSLTALRALGELSGKRFHQLPEREQRFLKTRVMRAIIISYESASSMKYEIFERLNTGSVDLNPQEIRNALFGGTLNDLTVSLERDRDFREIIGTKEPRARMVDRELILRFLAFHERLLGYKPSLLVFINDYMRDNRNASPAKIEELGFIFISTVRKVRSVFGSNAFRGTDTSGRLIVDRDGHPVERTVNRALFDAQMLAFAWSNDPDLESKRTSIHAAVGALRDDETFMDSIQRATGDRTRLFTRIRKYVTALRAAGVKIEAPDLPVDTLEAIGTSAGS